MVLHKYAVQAVMPHELGCFIYIDEYAINLFLCNISYYKILHLMAVTSLVYFHSTRRFGLRLRVPCSVEIIDGIHFAKLHNKLILINNK